MTPFYHNPKLPYLTDRSLRIVTGAYKSTPIRCLETEVGVPPLDLYLNKRLADFEKRLQEATSNTPNRGAGKGHHRSANYRGV